MKRFVLLFVSCIALTASGIAVAQTPSTDTAVMVGETPELGQFLTDAEGMTLYLFTKDEPGKSNCYDDCAVAWPPFMAEDASLPEGVPGELSVVTRDDGSEMLAYNGWPLYYWFEDKAPGDTTGHLVGDVWFVVEVGETTTPVASPAASPVASPAADTAVMVAETPELGQFLTDAAGMTLYIFTNDEAHSGVSVCNDDCATNWPPFHAEGAALPEGIEGELTEITRDDGSMQLAYNGMPLYYWANDAAPGDTTGHEVGDVWFVAVVGEE